MLTTKRWAPALTVIKRDAKLLEATGLHLPGAVLPLSLSGTISSEQLSFDITWQLGQELSPEVVQISVLLVIIGETPASRYHDGSQDLWVWYKSGTGSFLLVNKA